MPKPATNRRGRKPSTGGVRSKGSDFTVNTPSSGAQGGHLSERDFVKKHSRTAEQIAVEKAAEGQPVDEQRAEGLAELERDKALRRYVDARQPRTPPASEAYKRGWDRIWGKK